MVILCLILLMRIEAAITTLLRGRRLKIMSIYSPSGFSKNTKKSMRDILIKADRILIRVYFLFQTTMFFNWVFKYLSYFTERFINNYFLNRKMKKIEIVYLELLYKAIEKKTRISTQAELARSLGVSLSTVNAAVKVLETMGAVVIKP